MLPLSVVVITLNEEKNLERCLKSVKDLTDDIVIVDSFSTDSTEEIAKRYNARFISQKWLGYSGSKNIGNEKAKYDWILSLDADEELSPDLIKSIKEKFSPDNDSQVFSFNRLTNYCGKWIKHCGWYPDKKIRIWNKNTGSWEGSIHETIQFNKEIKEVFLDGDLHHYSYYTIQEHIQQANKYTSLSAEDLHRRGKRTNFIKILFSPPLKFVKDFILKAGFLDGWEGYVICRISAHAVFVKYAKLNQLNKTKKSNG